MVEHKRMRSWGSTAITFVMILTAVSLVSCSERGSGTPESREPGHIIGRAFTGASEYPPQIPVTLRNSDTPEAPPLRVVYTYYHDHRFEILAVPPGTYQVEAKYTSHRGTERWAAAAKVQAGETTYVSLEQTSLSPPETHPVVQEQQFLRDALPVIQELGFTPNRPESLLSPVDDMFSHWLFRSFAGTHNGLFTASDKQEFRARYEEPLKFMPNHHHIRAIQRCTFRNASTTKPDSPDLTIERWICDAEEAAARIVSILDGSTWSEFQKPPHDQWQVGGEIYLVSVRAASWLEEQRAIAAVLREATKTVEP